MPTLAPSFDKTKTLKGAWGRIDFTPTGGAVNVLSCKLFDADGKLSTVALMQPDTAGVLRAVDEVPLEATESITAVDLEEIDEMLVMLTGLTGHAKGVATCYFKDPRDATGTVAYKTNAFACSVKRPDGAVRIGGADFSKTSLMFLNLSGAPITWTRGAAAPDA